MNCWMAGFGVFDNSPVDVMTRRAPLQQPQPAACCGFAQQETRDVAAEVRATTIPAEHTTNCTASPDASGNSPDTPLRGTAVRTVAAHSPLRATRSWRIRLAFD